MSYFNFLASLCSWEDWFESHLVRNPEEGFVETRHISFPYKFLSYLTHLCWKEFPTHPYQVRIQKILSGGTLQYFPQSSMYFTGGGMDLPREAIWPKKCKCLSRGSVPKILREPIATCDFPGWGQTPLPPPSGFANALEESSSNLRVVGL